MHRRYLLVVILLLAGLAHAQKRSLNALPAELDFGSVSLGSSVTRSLALVNDGSQTFKITDLQSSSSEFVLSSVALPQSLAPGGTMTLTVTFKPQSEGAKTASVNILSNARHLTAIVVQGTGVSAQPVTAPQPTSTSQYGNVGDPYEGKVPGSAVILSACQLLMPNTSYRLAGNVNALTPTDICFQITGANTTLDLNGYQVSGRIVGNAVNINGTHIFNGTLVCDRDGALGGNVGCIFLYGDYFQPSAQLRVHHLNISNTAACGRSLHVSWDTTASWSGGQYLVRLYNITSTAAPGPSCLRAYNLSVFAGPGITTEASNNDVTCPADTAACQGIVFYGNDRSRMHHNRANLPQNLTEQTGRAFLCDGSADYCEVDNNLVIANNNRAFRVRDSMHARIHDNVVQRITCCSMAVHLGDPDTGSTDLDVIVERNTFEVADGMVLMIRGGYHAWFRNNAITCAGCTAGATLARVRTMGTTNISFENNPTATALGSPQIYVETTASATVCNSGQAAGTGAIAYSSACLTQ